jgi:protein-tyrosine-phosphatase
MATIVVVGAADTGRAPMAASLLRRRLGPRENDLAVESAGVLGHDGDPAEIEARDTMAHMGLDISAHAARSITGELAAAAALVLALDRGTAVVLRARFPEAAGRIYTLGELAGRQRDIPDPFRMQIGAWITYAREIDDLLRAALPRIAELLPQTTDDRPRPAVRRAHEPPGRRLRVLGTSALRRNTNRLSKYPNDPAQPVHFDDLPCSKCSASSMCAHDRRQVIFASDDRRVAQRAAGIRHQRGRDSEQRRPVGISRHTDQYLALPQLSSFVKRPNDPRRAGNSARRCSNATNRFFLCL